MREAQFAEATSAVYQVIGNGKTTDGVVHSRALRFVPSWDDAEGQKFRAMAKHMGGRAKLGRGSAEERHQAAA
ncbi:hypothetical protein [Variovorax rhizosphaerae]|uniref:Uncharacterized protein n=1 Tax=Variovorax rhizosphaerae TaxID=1836200 RepID=A0ABU8WYL3_9BURK